MYVKNSTKFQPRENRALTANNRPSVSAPEASFLRSTQQSPPSTGFIVSLCLVLSVQMGIRNHQATTTQFHRKGRGSFKLKLGASCMPIRTLSNTSAFALSSSMTTVYSSLDFYSTSTTVPDQLQGGHPYDRLSIIQLYEMGPKYRGLTSAVTGRSPRQEPK